MDDKVIKPIAALWENQTNPVCISQTPVTLPAARWISRDLAELCSHMVTNHQVPNGRNPYQFQTEAQLHFHLRIIYFYFSGCDLYGHAGL